MATTSEAARKRRMKIPADKRREEMKQLGKQRWQKMSQAEKDIHIQRMIRARHKKVV